jgi:hypothetical protein
MLEKTEGQSRMDNPKKLATLDTGRRQTKTKQSKTKQNKTNNYKQQHNK